MNSRPVRLAAFDLDGTLVRGPTICEQFAEHLGKLPRMREIEQLRDPVQISAARQEMLAWYGESRNALCGRLCHTEIAPGAHEAFEMLAKHGVQTAIVSITWNFAVAWFARKFGAGAWIGTDVSAAGEIHHFWPDDKPVWLSAHAKSLGIELDEVAAVGDSQGDVPMLAAVGRPFFVGAELPGEIKHAVHLPRADLREIAALILAR
jgi:phosphoserine phosphatase